jgi:hypothetical protein
MVIAAQPAVPETADTGGMMLEWAGRSHVLVTVCVVVAMLLLTAGAVVAADRPAVSHGRGLETVVVAPSDLYQA